MREHPIEGLMLTAMESIRSMIDVNTIVGEPIEVSNNITIIPISKVGFGLASGGSEFKDETIENYLRKQNDEESIHYQLPFGGGAGVGASISPIAFIVIQNDTVKVMPVEHNNGLDKLLDYIPDLMDRVNKFLDKKITCNENNDFKYNY
ncbi:MAG: sporulation protein YtfJ [Clostridiales bacterium]|nr:sporulation protein YtfJ [Clostridiales bacterium]